VVALRSFGSAALAALAGLVAFPGGGSAQSHLTVPASQNVVLFASSAVASQPEPCANGNGDRVKIRIMPDGIQAPFTVPSNAVLVITDVHPTILIPRPPAGESLSAGYEVRLTSPAASNVISTVLSSTFTNPGPGSMSTSENVSSTSGFTVSPGTQLCFVALKPYSVSFFGYFDIKK